jgi:hypothetical protein
VEDRPGEAAFLVRRRRLLAGVLAGELAGEPGVFDLFGQPGQRLALPIRQHDSVVAHGVLLNSLLRPFSRELPRRSAADTQTIGGGGGRLQPAVSE